METCQLLAKDPGRMTETRNPLPIILLAGPTGVGKTRLALDLAEAIGTEIVNADSMQVYRHMDIGSAKPTPEERSRVRHHLLDAADPDEPFDAARYLELARPVVDALHVLGKIPLVVGGTGLYMKVLLHGICEGPPADPALRERIAAEIEDRGLAPLRAELEAVDPVLARRIHPNDRQRIVRAVEVFRATGEPLSLWQSRHLFEESHYTALKFFLHRERGELYERIDRRVIEMVESGLPAEVQRLLALGYGPGLKSMQSLGYRQMTDHLLGKIDLDEAVRRTQRDTRRYAKRQVTWFRGDPGFQWVHADDGKEVLRRVREGLDRLRL